MLVMMTMRMIPVVILRRVSVSTLTQQLIHRSGEPRVGHPRGHPIGGSPLVPGHVTVLVTRTVAVTVLVVINDHGGEQVGEVQLLLLVGDEGAGEGVGVLGEGVGGAAAAALLVFALLPPRRSPRDLVPLS